MLWEKQWYNLQTGLIDQKDAIGSTLFNIKNPQLPVINVENLGKIKLQTSFEQQKKVFTVRKGSELIRQQSSLDKSPQRSSMKK